jgi:hypothetical protein
MRILSALALSAALSFAAEFVPLASGPESGSLNRQESLSNAKSRTAKVFAGDVVFPSIGSGSFYRTELTLINLEPRKITMSLRFFKLDGEDLYLNIENTGRVRGGRITIEPNEIFVIRSEKEANDNEGWALLTTDVIGDSIGSYTRWIFSIEGFADLKVTMPTVNRFENKTVLSFDNTEDGRSMGTIINGCVTGTNFRITVRNRDGSLIAEETGYLEPYTALSGYIDEAYPTTAGKRGTITVEATDFGIAAVGLALNGPSVSMLPALADADW